MNNSYSHVIWDWNGTLFNDVELCLDILNNLLMNYDLPPITLDVYREIFTFPVKDYYAKAGFDLNRLSFEELGQLWMNEYQQRRLEGKLFKSVFEILNNLKENKIEQSILSAYKYDTLLEMINHFNMSNLFTNVVGLDHIYATSKLELGKELIKKLHNHNGAVILIGDTVHDFEVSREMGCDCILIAGGHQSKEKLLKCRVQVFDDIAQLLTKSVIRKNEFII